MNDYQIISWIFYAIARASHKSPCSIKEFSMIADGINHSIPSPREIKDLTKWLLKNDMIAIHLKKYSLTKKGHIIYGFAHLSADNILNTWKNLELQMKKIS